MPKLIRQTKSEAKFFVGILPGEDNGTIWATETLATDVPKDQVAALKKELEEREFTIKVSYRRRRLVEASDAKEAA